MIAPENEIKKRIQDLYKRYHRPEYMGLDPLVCVHRYKEERDIEVAGFTAAILSYGRVETIIASVDRILKTTGERPFEFVVKTGIREKRRAFKGFKHRFNTGDDIALVLESLRRILSEYGSIEGYFLSFRDASCFRERLDLFVQGIREQVKGFKGGGSKGFRYLLPLPGSGSACKRLNMFLRWMIRPEDGIDFGIWRNSSPADLIVPLDVHVARIAADLRITLRKTPDWKTAQEVTDFLKGISPQDPVKFDFSLCRYGMLLLRDLSHKQS